MNQSYENVQKLQQLIALYLAKKRWSQATLARELGCHPSTLSKWLDGTNRITPNYLQKLSAILELSRDEQITLYSLAGRSNNISDIQEKDAIISQNFVQASKPVAQSTVFSQYLNWLIHRNLYLDPKLYFWTKYQIPVTLDDVYVALQVKQERVGLNSRSNEFTGDNQLSKNRFTANTLDEEPQARFTMPEHPNAKEEILSVEEATRISRKVVILGDPGSGKSTFLRSLLLDHARALSRNDNPSVQVRNNDKQLIGDPRFPIYARIADYAENISWREIPFSEFLVKHCIAYECPKDGLADLIMSKLDEGNCLVLLDGLDEITIADVRRRVIQKIEEFIRRYDFKDNHFVVTSRIAGYRITPLGSEFTTYSIYHMDSRRIHLFVERWYLALSRTVISNSILDAQASAISKEIAALLQIIQVNPGLGNLAKTPLLLWLFILIYRTGAKIPQLRVEVYKLTSDILAKQWRISQGISESSLVYERYVNRLLEKLAYWIHLHKPTGIATAKEVHEILGEEWAHIHHINWDIDDPDLRIQHEIDQFLTAVREHTGLFVEREVGRFGFMHLTFEEYYVARHLISQRKNRVMMIRKHIHDSRWKEPILLALNLVALDNPAEAAQLLDIAILAQGEEAKLQSITPSLFEELLGRDYLFALSCLGDQVPVNPQTEQTLIQRLADELLYDRGLARYECYKEKLRENLAHLRGSKSASLLTEILIDPLHELLNEVSNTTKQSPTEPLQEQLVKLTQKRKGKKQINL